jgi:hypothetical protein
VRHKDLLRPNGPSRSRNLLPTAIPLNHQMDFSMAGSQGAKEKVLTLDYTPGCSFLEWSLGHANRHRR